MTAKMIKIGVCIAAVALLSVVNVKAGGAVSVYYNNGAENFASFGSPFYDAGTNRLAIGDLVQLIAIQGGTNYVLASEAIGNIDAQLTIDLGNGWINAKAGHVSQSSVVLSNAAAAAAGSPLGLKFYTGTTVANSEYYGIVQNLGIVGESPNWLTPPAGPTIFEPDWNNAAYLGIRTVDISTIGGGNDNGFIANVSNPDFVVPEPSTLALVGIGLFGALGMIRRHRNS